MWYSWLARERVQPLLFADEFVYLRVAAWINGYDWSPGISNVPWGAPLYGLIAAPLFMVLDHSEHMYRALIALNICLTLAAFSVAFRTLRIALPGTPHFKRLAACALAFVFPAASINPQFAWPEPLLLLLAWCCALLVALPERGSYPWQKVIALVFLSLAMTTAHSRGLAIPLALGIFFSIKFRKNEITKASLNARLIALTMGATAGLLVQSWLRRSMNLPMMYGVQHSPMRFMDRLADNFLHNPHTKFLDLLMGQSAYILAAPLGLAFLGMLSHYKVKNPPSCNTSKSLTLFFTIQLGAMLLLGAAFFSTPTRFDQFFYGRYVEPFLSPFIALGAIVVLSKTSSRPRTATTVFAAFLVSAVFIALAWPAIQINHSTSTSWLMITSWSQLADMGLTHTRLALCSAITATGVASSLLILISRRTYIVVAALWLMMQPFAFFKIYSEPRVELMSAPATAINDILSRGFRADEIHVRRFNNSWRISMMLQTRFKSEHVTLEETPIKFAPSETTLCQIIITDDSTINRPNQLESTYRKEWSGNDIFAFATDKDDCWDQS